MPDRNEYFFLQFLVLLDTATHYMHIHNTIYDLLANPPVSTSPNHTVIIKYGHLAFAVHPACTLHVRACTCMYVHVHACTALVQLIVMSGTICGSTASIASDKNGTSTKVNLSNLTQLAKLNRKLAASHLCHLCHQVR